MDNFQPVNDANPSNMTIGELYFLVKDPSRNIDDDTDVVLDNLVNIPLGVLIDHGDVIYKACELINDTRLDEIATIVENVHASKTQ